ncbi:MAG: 6-pyruvoyl trahydropterin synthase family protein [Promethearchaeota archaeon]
MVSMAFKIIIQGTQYKFSSAHFIVDHDKCSRIHGHNFHVRLEVQGPLDDKFFVVDFMIVKKLLVEEIKALDHKLLVPGKSETISVKEGEGGRNLEIAFSGKAYSIPKEDVLVLDLPAITSELLARYMFSRMKGKLPGCKLKVGVGETRSSDAEYWED